MTRFIFWREMFIRAVPLNVTRHLTIFFFWSWPSTAGCCGIFSNDEAAQICSWPLWSIESGHTSSSRLQREIRSNWIRIFRRTALAPKDEIDNLSAIWLFKTKPPLVGSAWSWRDPKLSNGRPLRHTSWSAVATFDWPYKSDKVSSGVEWNFFHPQK